MAIYPNVASLAETESEIQRRLLEVKRCRDSLAYFCTHYCKILASSDRDGAWIPFVLWPAQERVAEELEQHREIIALKARQLGFTWLVIAGLLKRLLFHPVQTLLVFSKDDSSAMELIYRLRSMYMHLPDWMRTDKITVDNQHEFALLSGSRCRGFATTTTSGRSFTGDTAFIDEADHAGNLQAMLTAIAPCVDNGGRLILLSTADKSQPESHFKKLFRAATAKENSFHPIFHGWQAAPWRTQAWYEEKKRSTLAASGALDDLRQEYPATVAEAIAPKELDKRLPSLWLLKCFDERPPLAYDGTPGLRQPAVQNLLVFSPPRSGRNYVLSCDPAEGNPTSDDSALDVLDIANGEQVATLAGRFEVATFAAIVDTVGRWYSVLGILTERNLHGHALIMWLRQNSPLQLMCGLDGHAGYFTSAKSKAVLYDTAAEMLRDGEAVIRDFTTFAQLSSIEGSSLRAPSGQKDDKGVSYVLGLMACFKFAAHGNVGEPVLLGKGKENYPGQWDSIPDYEFSEPGKRSGTLRFQPGQDPFDDGPFIG